MSSPKPPSAPESRATTPNPSIATASSRFIAPQTTAEDVLKSQTVGLVQLSDYRKRRAEAIEQQLSGASSGASTPTGGTARTKPLKKKLKKNLAKGKLSFGMDDDEDASESSAHPTPRSRTPVSGVEAVDGSAGPFKRKLAPNSAVGFAPKALAKSALLKEQHTRDQLRKEFLAMQELVKATEIALPFVFYDGTNVPGGVCRVKKGDHVWLFLDKARKVGAELGVGGDMGRKGWARISVDDLMLVRGEIIIPHHYEFYYFVVNKSVGFDGRLFNYSAEPTSATPKPSAEVEDELAYDPLNAPKKKKDKASQMADSELEGFDDDASLTKVVDRRWYEKNKHIFPASIWEEFDPTKDYSSGQRKDAAGNALFFS